MRQLYRMHDAPDAPKAAIPVSTAAEARAWNTPERGFGVFWTVNDFAGARRKENLTRINAWCVDMDEGTKAEMVAKLNRSPLIPSLVVETRRGFQAYWGAADGKAAHWNAIVLERLVPAFGADKNARDLCRILRVPGFLHLKDPTQPFKCVAVWKRDVLYTERQMAEAFRWVPDPRAVEQAQREAEREQRAAGRTQEPTEDFWQAVAAIDCRDALERLSGSGWVNGERYTFRRVSNGNTNILVDGKGTSCFVDTNGKIGSMSGGGPLIVHWLRWLGRSWKEAIEAVKQIYPHIAELDERNRQSRRAA